VRKTNGFSLIELMIAMGILTVIATVAVPKVQVWNARNRGLQTVMELISDFSKARSVAGYTVVGSSNNSINIPVNISDDSEGAATMPVYMGVRRQTAMVFRKSEYAIYQKQSMDTSTWDATAVQLKKNMLLDTVTIESVNGGTPSSNVASFATALNFTSTGMLKKSTGEFYGNQSTGLCGDVSERYLPKIVFSVVIRSRVSSSGNDSIWYRLDIDQRGEYSVCTVFKEASSISNTDFANNGVMLDI